MGNVKEKYDLIAKDYDSYFSSDEAIAEDKAVMKLLENLNSEHLPVIDMGCGTGLYLDYNKLSKKDYHGFDISEGMINQALKKYPNHNFEVLKIEDWKMKESPFGYFLISLYGSMSYVEPSAVKRIVEHSANICFMFFNDGYVPVTHVNFGFECKYYTYSDYKSFLKEEDNFHLVNFGNYSIVWRYED